MHQLLSQDELNEILNVAAEARLADDRLALLAPIDPDYVQKLPTNNRPLTQLSLDLWEMNRTVWVVGTGLPLKQWLTQASILLGVDPRRDLFKKFAAKLPELPSDSVEKTAAVG